jgi:hypothetical protein
MDNTPEIKKIKEQIADIELAIEKIATAIQMICVGIPEGRADACAIGRKIQQELQKKEKQDD